METENHLPPTVPVKKKINICYHKKLHIQLFGVYKYLIKRLLHMFFYKL